YQWLQNVEFPFAFDFRAELEGRAGGNPSFNNGVNYLSQLKKSVNYDEVQALYTAAGLDLNADLATLKAAQRITADPGALTYLKENVIYNGQITVPVLTMHTTGDGLVAVQEEQAYSSVVTKAKDKAFLKEIFVHRAGHCEFSPAEMITALQTLELRPTGGKWKGLSPATLNNEATALGPEFNVIDVNGQIVAASPAFETYKPAKFLRPYDAFSK
ncbi:MAG: hypothetical protein ACRD3Q_02595, partial [Terriglobales bacterium]